MDQINNAELTKAGQPRTARGALPGPGTDYGNEIAHGLAVKEATLATERGKVARSIAIDLGYSFADAARFEDAAIDATRDGIDLNPYAGRVRIGRKGAELRLSVVGPTGALFDPTKPLGPDNNLGGSD